MDELVAAVDKIDRFRAPNAVRYFEERFSIETMINRYEQVYDRLIEPSEECRKNLSDQVARRRPLGELEGWREDLAV